jgi:hypothetical protein
MPLNVLYEFNLAHDKRPVLNGANKKWQGTSVVQALAVNF